MKLFKIHINAEFLLMFMMSMMNMIFLHQYFLHTIDLEVGCFVSSFFDNLLACLIDVTFVLLVSWIITLRRLRASLAITFVITLLWSFCNVFYARFFHQYLSWSSIGLAGNLSDPIVLDSMTAGFRLIDIYYPLAIVTFCWIYFRSKHHDVKSKSLRTLSYIWSCGLLISLTVHGVYAFHPHIGIVYELEKTVFTPAKMDSMWPNWTVYHKGFFRKLFVDQLKRKSKIELTKEQEAAIEKEYSDHSQRITGRTAPNNIQNVIFILVESYLSVTSDLVVDGQEITPNLNKLKRDSNVYYNGHMIPNVSIGESSDGQLIYMAGLLPLHSEITVSKAKKNCIIGLPEQIKKAYPNLQSLTIIPTNPSLWDQQAMSDSYGFDKLYSMLDYQAEMKDNENGAFLTDEMIFRYASKKDESNQPPFFSLILTMSMHQPFNSFVEHGFHLTDKNLPQEYKNYLTNCHYTDIQIGKYLNDLKDKGLYDNSLIVIVSDHDAHPDYLGMDDKISREIPIYIVNGGIDNSNAWSGECNQLDVYTTILDIMGIQSKWRGFGHTLLNKKYHNSVTGDIQEMSDWIIYSDYFSNRDIP